MATVSGRKGNKNALAEKLNNQIREREAERLQEIQSKRAEELAALKSRSHKNTGKLTDCGWNILCFVFG
jgi:hypothetical protein